MLMLVVFLGLACFLWKKASAQEKRDAAFCQCPEKCQDCGKTKPETSGSKAWGSGHKDNDRR